MSLLQIPRKKVKDDKLGQSIKELIEAAKKDSTKWVQATAYQVEQFLPAYLATSTSAAEESTDHNRRDDGNPFTKSLSRLVDRINTDVAGAGKRNNLPSLTFLPFEYSHFHQAALPSGFNVQALSKNIHFKVVEDSETQTSLTQSSEHSQQQHPSQMYRGPESKSPLSSSKSHYHSQNQSSGFPGSFQGRPSTAERKINEAEVQSRLKSLQERNQSGSFQKQNIKMLNPNQLPRPVSGHKRPISAITNSKPIVASRSVPTNISERSNGSMNGKKDEATAGSLYTISTSQRTVLLDILNSGNKLTEGSKAVIQGYLNGEHFKAGMKGPKDNVTLLISENRSKVDHTHLKVEQTKLKIDYKHKTIKKVKAVKRYRVKS